MRNLILIHLKNCSKKAMKAGKAENRERKTIT